MNFILLIVLLILLLIVVFIISVSNKLNRCIVKIEEADSGIDVALTKRYDVLMKMIDVVKKYKEYESETLFEIVKLRKDMTLKEKCVVNDAISRNLEKISVIVESYPDLNSNHNFKTLQESIVDVEEHLQAARRVYNSNISRYNQLLVTFPINIIANFKSLKLKEFFEVEEIKKSDAKIEL